MLHHAVPGWRTLDYEPSIKSQLALHNQLQGRICSKFGHVICENLNLEAVGRLPDGALDVEVQGAVLMSEGPHVFDVSGSRIGDQGDMTQNHRVTSPIRKPYGSKRWITTLLSKLPGSGWRASERRA